jgi:hypothetical protein
MRMQVPTYLPCVLSLRKRLRGLIGRRKRLSVRERSTRIRVRAPHLHRSALDFVLRASRPPLPADVSCDTVPRTRPATPDPDRRRRMVSITPAQESARSIAERRQDLRRRSFVGLPPTTPSPTRDPTPAHATRRSNPCDPPPPPPPRGSWSLVWSMPERVRTHHDNDESLSQRDHTPIRERRPRAR